MTADHWVEVDLGDDAPKEGPVLLVARGWIHPTDSSINVAIEQGGHDRPRPLVLEVPDGKGGWKAGLPALGFRELRNVHGAEFRSAHGAKLSFFVEIVGKILVVHGFCGCRIE